MGIKLVQSKSRRALSGMSRRVVNDSMRRIKRAGAYRVTVNTKKLRNMAEIMSYTSSPDSVELEGITKARIKVRQKWLPQVVPDHKRRWYYCRRHRRRTLVNKIWVGESDPVCPQYIVAEARIMHTVTARNILKGIIKMYRSLLELW